MMISLILITSLVAMMIIVVVSNYASQKKVIRQLQEQNAQLATVFKDLRALFSADIVFGKSMTELNSQIVALDNKIEQLENSRNNDGTYPHALKILDMGGSKQEIMDNCKLTNAEAELLLNLHAYRTATTMSS